MEAILGINKILSNIPVSGIIKSVVEAVTGDQKQDTNFESTLSSLLTPDQANKVSEEELFAGLVQQRIQHTKGDSAFAEFTELFNAAKSRLQKPNGFIPVEDAAKEALREFRDAQKITKEEADSIYSQAFAAAQLDDNKDALYDGHGGPNDPTIAVAEMEQALMLSGALISKFDAGSQQATARALDELSNVAPTTSGSSSKGSNGTSPSSEASGTGFLFKPVSESDGKLVVLLPPRLSGLVQGLLLIGPNGEIVETGRYSGNANGGRDHYRFSKPGGKYPDGVTVQARLVTGELVRYIIQETSQRTENIDPKNSKPGDNGSNNLPNNNDLPL